MTNLKRRTPKIFFIILILVFPFLVVKIMFICNSDRIALDGRRAEIWGLLYMTNTNYSKDYSHAKFAKIKLGMTEKEVIDILGEPITRWQPYKHTNFHDKRHFVGLQYSEHPSDSYRLRQVYLDSGIVAEVIHYFYFD